MTRSLGSAPRQRSKIIDSARRAENHVRRGRQATTELSIPGRPNRLRPEHSLAETKSARSGPHTRRSIPNRPDDQALTLLRRLPVIVRYPASADGTGCGRPPEVLSGRMARDHRHRTKRRVSATAHGGEIAGHPLSTVDTGDGGPCETFVIIDDLPAMVAISSRELDVIEAFLGTLLDDLLK